METLRLNSLLKTDLKELRDFLNGKSEMLVVTHFFPDGDAVGSLIAFGGMLDQLEIPHILAIDDACPGKYSFLDGFSEIRNLKADPLDRTFERAVILDAGAISRIGSAQKAITKSTRVLNIDHHFTGDIYGNINLVNTQAAATSEILFDLFTDLGIEITKKMAAALYTGILTDTGRFRFANTTSHSMHVAADLLLKGIDAGVLTENIYYNMPVHQMTALAKALFSIELYSDNRICVIGLDGDETTDDTEGFVEYAASIKGAELAVFYSETEQELFKVSLRSRCDVDVSLVATRFGGGGHQKASGFRFRGNLTTLKQRLITVLAEYLPPVAPSSTSETPLG